MEKTYPKNPVTLSFGKTIGESFTIGLKNIPSILGCLILWVLTLWIPYINVGTTIAISTLPIALSRGTVVNPLDIFQSKYRRFMGEYFTVVAFMIIPMVCASAFLLIPGFVLGLTWSIAIYLVLDKGTNPAEALTESNQATYGSKWTMFWAKFCVSIISVLIYMFLVGVSTLFTSGPINLESPSVTTLIVMAIGLIISAALNIAVNASIYGQLVKNLEE